MPRKRSSNRPPTSSSSSSSGRGGGGSVEPSPEVRLMTIDEALKQCRKKVEKLVEKQKGHYKFLNGVLCEIAPGLYNNEATPQIIATLCAAHNMSTNVGIMQSMLQIEALRDQVKSMFADPSSSSLEQRMSYLMQMEMRAFGAFQNGPPEEHLNPEEFQAEVRQDVEMFRTSIYPILPAVTPEQRSNAMTHATPKSLPATYFELIHASVEEPDRAELNLKKATELVPACHIAWRLLALVTIEKLPSRKSKKVDRIADSLKPLSYFVKVVQLLPKDFRVWWHIAKHLYRTEVDYAGCPKLRSLIYVTINNKKYSSWDCFARVLELEPNVPVFWFYLGQSMLRSHHLFDKEERMVDINFVSGPKMTEVTARYCYEAYTGISPTNNYLPWFHVANAMLNEKDVMVDVDDAFTSIELNGGITLTRPEVLVKMISVEPHNTDMWVFLHRTLATEPESYRLPLEGLSVPGIDKNTKSLSALDCLERALEIEPRSGGSWLAMYDFLHRRDTLQDDLHKVRPHTDDSKNASKKFSSCVVSGKTYTKFDCVLMVHMLYVASAPAGCVSGEKEVFDLWLVVASWACDSPSGKITLPQGKEVLPLKDVNNISYKTKTCQMSFPDAFLKSFGEFRRWGCEVRLRLLHLLRDKGEELGRRWPEAVYMMYDLLPKKNMCGLDCANCCLLVATCLKLSNTSKADAHTAHVTAKLNACASLDPESWEELGKMLSPNKKIKIFTNDETSEEYTQVDCFKLAIESSKRWNRADAWLALGNALKEGETVDIYDKPHTSQDCFKQSWLWFDERPNDQLMSQLSRKAPVPHHIHGTGESGDGSDEESTAEEEEDSDFGESSDSDVEITQGAAAVSGEKKKEC